ncbi:MAG: Phosphotransferase involved in threonylcarbamoyladenosine t(6)A37 formation in tRNA [Rhodanobacteraceae bacterium]|jgi:aminoglycoside/choline kinase family phosphotransferase|nr:MAG: Phosphotransferase involved in threonylcarbamoyladenosine t(6)A37 formation in tRNA [Rhodanobacteraceae bacterium]
MNPPPTTHVAVPDRAAARLAFARHASHDAQAALEAASEDASARSYWRVRGARGSAIVMDAPPGSGNLDAWLDVDARLRAAGLNAPEVLAEDRAQGFLLLSDLGTRPYLSELNDATADALYADALDALLAIQTRVDPAGLPRYDEPLLVRELELLPTWFLQRHLGISIECDEWDIIEVAFRLLTDNALRQPQVFVHRDYHSRNLMRVPEHNPGIVDLQDAVSGPVSYDLVSLLRDCYIAWDGDRVRDWAEAYRRRLIDAGALDHRVDATRWQRWFDLTGLQRHLKVLGIFCRLWYRDSKRGYLADLPRVWHYVRSVTSGYPELRDFLALLERWVGGRDLTEPRT